MKNRFFIFFFLLVPSLSFGSALPVSDLLNAADDYWKTSSPQKPVLIQGGKINSTQQYIPVPTSATMGLVGYASGAASLGGLAFYQHTGKDPATAFIDGVSHVVQPAWIAFQENFVSPETFPAAAAQYVGVEAVLGAKLADIYDHVKNSPSSAFAALRSLFSLNETFPTYNLGRNLVPADTFKGINGATYTVGTYSYTGAAQFYPTYAQVPLPAAFNTADVKWIDNNFPGSGQTANYYQSGNRLYQYIIRKYPADPSRGYEGIQGYFNVTLLPDSTPAINPEGGLNLSSAHDAISQAFNTDQAEIIQDVGSAIKELPPQQVLIAADPVPSTTTSISLEHPSLSPQAIEQFFAENAAQVANLATQTASDPNATPAEIAAAQVAADAARAINEQTQSQMEPQPETYSDVPLSGFEEPYNPGPFDIPDRFDTFLANVATTGLFSLPSQYFNSLPGGGSPTYTIEAGQYGTHTVDLSETMGSGLAVLKTVLLLCFAFLSIRVVVLKR